MKGPPDTPYAEGAFELYCQFGEDYPLKPPTVRFLTPIYHCNVNSVGRICHNIFDRDYSAHVTMKEILEAVFGLLIAPEAEDPLDSILAEQFQSCREQYEEVAQKSTKQAAATPIEDIEKQLVGQDLRQAQIPSHLICKLSKKMFVDPVKTPYGDIYERQAIEDALQKQKTDPFSNRPLDVKDLKPHREMKIMAQKHRESEIQEIA
ncbi:ubiquitin-conjugating enzyme E2-17 kDa-like isoform X3 [Anguilla anguilla]|nr:ubiquitin-conjugating enzyme E2-17 kDa-like isoform X3 [Anguilla anguilla]